MFLYPGNEATHSERYKKHGLPRRLNGKESICNAGVAKDTGSVPGLWRSPGGRHGNPLHVLPGDSNGPWTEEPGGQQSIESLRVGHD